MIIDYFRSISIKVNNAKKQHFDFFFQVSIKKEKNERFFFKNYNIDNIKVV